MQRGSLGLSDHCHSSFPVMLHVAEYHHGPTHVLQRGRKEEAVHSIGAEVATRRTIPPYPPDAWPPLATTTAVYTGISGFAPSGSSTSKAASICPTSQ